MGLATAILTSLEDTKELEKQDVNMTQENVYLGKHASLYLSNPSLNASLSENQVYFLDYKGRVKVPS